MTTNISANGTDLDAIFMPRITTKRADVNILSNGSVDVSNRFEKYTSAPKATTTNILVGSGPAADLADLFQSISTPIMTLGAYTISQGPKTTSAATTVGIRFNADGTIDEYAQATGWTYLGDWLSPTSSGDTTYDFLMHVDTEAGGSGFTTGAQDTWLAAGSASWTMLDPTSDDGAHTMNCTVSVRKDGGATLDTGTVDFSATWIIL